MSEVVIDGDGGRRLALRLAHGQDADAVWAYLATLSLPEGELRAEIWDHGDGLSRLFRDLADAWRGFDGAVEYDSLEGQLGFSCTHDGLGMVACRVVLRQPAPPEWSIEAVLHLGGGAHLERLAGEVDAFVAAARAARTE